MVPPGDYQRRLGACTLFVAHVGMGSILQALEIGKQMVLLPRQAAQREVFDQFTIGEHALAIAFEPGVESSHRPHAGAGAPGSVGAVAPGVALAAAPQRPLRKLGR